MRKAALVRFRRHHPDVVGERAGNPLENGKALGMDAIVIGQQNSHLNPCRKTRLNRPFRSS
jgi:hypothetical protein